MKLLVLHIYNAGPAYDEMLVEQRKIEMAWFPGVTRYFVTYRKNPSQEEVAVEGDMIYVEGEERGILGITEKTLLALKHLQVLSFDYVLRSNISTFMNYAVLLNALKSLPRTHLYTGAFIFDAGLQFAQGTCILMSADQADKLVQQRDLVSRVIVDDVTFAIFFRDHSPEAYRTLGNPAVKGHWVFPHQTPEEVERSLSTASLVRLRVNAEDQERGRDLALMRRLVDHVSSAFKLLP